MAGNTSWRQVCCSIIVIFWASLSMDQAFASATQGHYSAGNGDLSSPSEPYSSPEYQFSYGVRDSKYGNDFGHEEERNGHETKGRYKVQLPDGRVQVVSYVADRNGYRADVTYENSGYSSSSSSSSFPSSGSNSGGATVQTSESRHSAYSSLQQPQQQANSGRSFSTLKTKINGRYYGY